MFYYLDRSISKLVCWILAKLLDVSKTSTILKYYLYFGNFEILNGMNDMNLKCEKRKFKRNFRESCVGVFIHCVDLISLCYGINH